MASVGSMSQLERMGSELKCPICLSLFKNAATISCNHTFCRSCILESMRSNACCPVCKTHSTRREVRQAPQMDSLVEIFRGMESSVGVCLFPTQSSTQPAHPSTGHVDDKAQAKFGKGRPKRNSALPKKTNDTNKSLDPRKRQRRGKSVHLELDDQYEEESLGEQDEQAVANAQSPDPPKGVVLAKKRVQVPQSSHLFLDLNLQSGVELESIGSELDLNDNLPSEYRPSSSILENPTPSEIAEINPRPGLPLEFLKPPVELALPHINQEEVSERLVEVLRSDDREGQNKSVDLNLDLELQGFPSLRQAFNELPQLTPFFWLPNEATLTQDELPTEAQLSAQAVRPAFSDLKDSDDEGSLDDVQQPNTLQERGFAEAEGYDSETFKWTQRPCSPELSCSPTRYGMQTCSTLSYRDPHVDDAALKERVEGSIRSLPSALEVKLVDETLSSEVQQKTIRNSDQGPPNLCIGSSSDHEEAIHHQNLCGSSRTRSSNFGASHPTPRPVVMTLPTSQCKPTSNFPTDEKVTEPKQPLSNQSKDCAAAANLFLNLLRDVPPDVVRQPVSGDGAPMSLKDQVEEFSRGQNPESVGKSKTVLSVSKAVPSTASPDCKFCGSTGNSEVAGEMMRYQTGTLRNKDVYVHKLCAEWAPNVYFEDDNYPKNLTSEISRGSRIKCSNCGKKGAALGCCNSKCKNSYHYPCARLLKGCQWNEDDFVMFCPQHARGRFPNARRQSRDSSNSTLENDPVEIPSVSADHTHVRGDRRAPTNSEDHRALKWAPAPAQKWVLCGSGLDSQLKGQVASFASLVGATLVKDWSPAVTHVITGTDEQGAAKRTLKYLLAMLEGKWIVTIDWMNECILKKQPVPEEPFLVACDVNGFFGGPCLSRHLAVSKARKLFEGLSFYLCGDFTSVLKADLHSLVTAGGGTVLHRKPLPLPVSSYSELSPDLQDTPHPGQSVVLYNGEAESGRRNLAQRIQEAMSVSIPAGAYALPCSWLLDSIAHCRLLPPN